MSSEISMAVAGTSSTSPKKDELVFLYLQLQRTLVIWAVSVCRRLDLWLGREDQLAIFSTHILDVENEPEVSQSLEILQNHARRWPVRIAMWIHIQMDESRTLKDCFITLILWLRRLVWWLWPQKRFGRYDLWVKTCDTLSDEDRKQIQETALTSSEAPRLSVILWRPQFTDVHAQVQAVARQPYPHWDLAVCGERAALDQVQAASGGLALDRHPRIIENANTKANLERLRDQPGEALVFVHGHGHLSERALAEIAQALQSEPQVSVIYGDEDSLTRKNVRYRPRFHPDFCLRYMVGQSYFRNLFVIRRSHFESVLKGLSDTATYWDFILQAVLSAPQENIKHVARVLFHSYLRKYAPDPLWFEAVRCQIEKRFPGAHVERGRNREPRIIWPLPERLPKVSAIIPTKDRVDLLTKLVNGLLQRTDYDNLEIVIIDNQSREEKTRRYLESLKGNERIKVISYPHSFNFSAINNFGVRHATGEILALLNNDLEVINAQWLKEMVREAFCPDVGIVGAKLFFKNGFIQHAGVAVGVGQVSVHTHALQHQSSRGYCDRLIIPHRLSAVTGACMVMRREVFERVNGFNEDLAVAYNDIDICLRVNEAGLSVIWTPYARLYHLESASRPPDRRIAQIARYRKEVCYMRLRWQKTIQNDPYYNPNLSRLQSSFQVGITESVDVRVFPD